MITLLNLKRCLLFALLILFSINCVDYRTVKREIYSADSFQTLDKNSPYLKVHMFNGRVYILSNWQVDENQNIVMGEGTLLGVNRDTMTTSVFTISIDSVAIFETNVLRRSGPMTAITIFAGISAAVTAACLANPKACFGSCPTFYVLDDRDSLLQAEGFSSSIAPPLEATDIDALFRVSPSRRNVTIEMRNEALETHVVRSVNLLAVPRLNKKRVYKDTKNQFWISSSASAPDVCIAPEGDCRGLIKAFDGMERYSQADSSFLGEKEIINLTFKNIPEGQTGLLIASRQTLLSTFLFYQTLSYMGHNVGNWFTIMDQLNENPVINNLREELGCIEVLVPDITGNWKVAGKGGEHGPLATDLFVVPLPDTELSDSMTLKLKLTKGNWRLDYVALVNLESVVVPIEIEPSMVWKDNRINSSVLTILKDAESTLITMPGEKYQMEYILPESPDQYELFLKSRGYYLEWMRQEWQKDENYARLMQVLFSTNAALKMLAPEFKKIEADMEDSFWRSRYAKP